jgi:hypothetical protein
MNDKIQAILLKIILEMKKENWSVAPDWEVTLKGEGHVPLSKRVRVQGNLDDDEWSDDIETTIDLKLGSEDELTYFPEYTVYASIFIEGGGIEDIAYKMNASVAFTEHDVRDDAKAASAAKRITRLVEDHVEAAYSDYIDENGSAITDYKNGGWKADADDDR